MPKKLEKPLLSGELPVGYMKEGDLVVAYSPAIDLSSCGASLPEARKNFLDAVTLFFESCIRRGTLSEVLRSCGWELVKIRNKPTWKPPRQFKNEKIDIGELVG